MKDTGEFGCIRFGVLMSLRSSILSISASCGKPLSTYLRDAWVKDTL